MPRQTNGRTSAEAELLDRKCLSEVVFSTANGRCVFCTAPAVDAHHMLERKFFIDGDYDAGNGVAVCEDHHCQCETTKLTVEEVRRAANIESKNLPRL